MSAFTDFLRFHGVFQVKYLQLRYCDHTLL